MRKRFLRVGKVNINVLSWDGILWEVGFDELIKKPKKCESAPSANTFMSLGRCLGDCVKGVYLIQIV